MRKWTYTLIGLLLCSPALYGQAAPAPAAPGKVDEYLNQWEQKMKAVETLIGDCVRTEKSKTFNTLKVYEGKSTFMRPNFAILDLRNQKKPDQFEKYICTGTYLYEYSQMNKTIRVHDIQSKGAGGNDENFLSFLFGMKAEEAKKRYDLKLAKEDQYYLYIDIVAKNEADKVDFARAQLVLIKGSFLPRRLWFEQPNGDEVTWDLPKTQLNPRLDRRMFEAPKPPDGWTLERVPKAVDAGPKSPPPRVYRPNQ
jgi:TIGR03009 family protein